MSRLKAKSDLTLLALTDDEGSEVCCSPSSYRLVAAHLLVQR